MVAIADSVVRRLGRADYEPTWRAMQAFTDARDDATPDELWLVEHPPVFTLGRAARREHLRDPGAVPVVQVDRGGQVTYHGPGQVVLYALVDLQRRGFGVRRLVTALEGAIVDTLGRHGVTAQALAGAPGVYVGGAKIAALGLRIRRGCSFHGLALNVDVDLAPFERIDPCGFRGLAVTRTRDQGIAADAATLGEEMVTALAARLNHRGANVDAPALETP